MKPYITAFVFAWWYRHFISTIADRQQSLALNPSRIFCRALRWAFLTTFLGTRVASSSVYSNHTTPTYGRRYKVLHFPQGYYLILSVVAFQNFPVVITRTHFRGT